MIREIFKVVAVLLMVGYGGQQASGQEGAEDRAAKELTAGHLDRLRDGERIIPCCR